MTACTRELAARPADLNRLLVWIGPAVTIGTCTVRTASQGSRLSTTWSDRHATRRVTCRP